MVEIGGNVYYFRSPSSVDAFVVISDSERMLTYNGERSLYYINQPPQDRECVGGDFYIINPLAL